MFTIERKDQRGNWHTDATGLTEEDAVLTARQIEQAYPFDIVQIVDESKETGF